MKRILFTLLFPLVLGSCSKDRLESHIPIKVTFKSESTEGGSYNYVNPKDQTSIGKYITSGTFETKDTVNVADKIHVWMSSENGSTDKYTIILTVNNKEVKSISGEKGLPRVDLQYTVTQDNL